MKKQAHNLRIIVVVAAVVLVTGQSVATYSASNKRSPEGPETCIQASDCGKRGCCLKGKCSYTGRINGRCYVNVKENGQVRPAGMWNLTDLCPCEYTYYCYSYLPGGSEVDPIYGTVGSCYAIMG